MLASHRSHLPAPWRFFLGLFSGVILCFAMQAACYYGLGWKTGKGESNYFSTYGRFQAAASPPAEIALVGSSITGRIPGREAGNQEVANLGSDGGPALDGIRLIGMDRIETPKWLVIETNTLYGGMGQSDTLIVKGAQAPWFEVGTRFPLFGAMARPSAMLYSFFLRRSVVQDAEAFNVSLDQIAQGTKEQSFELTEAEKACLNIYISELAEIQKRHCRILLVTYPAGNRNERENWLMRYTIAELSKHVPLSYIDLEKQIPRNDLQFTDSVHLGSYSSAKVLASIKQVIHYILTTK
ncbi:MAG: hypothetical protein RLZZ553_750 [Verrucomicrobiota bacterium]|jgi:hypothetical protein